MDMFAWPIKSACSVKGKTPNKRKTSAAKAKGNKINNRKATPKVNKQLSSIKDFVMSGEAGKASLTQEAISEEDNERLSSDNEETAVKGRIASGNIK